MFFVVFLSWYAWGYRCVFVVVFFTPPLARDSLSRSLRACLRLTEKRWKIAPVLQIQAFSMKLRVHRFFFLVFLHIKTDCKNKLFFYKHINIQIRRFFSELVESESCGKYCLIMIRIGMNTALLKCFLSLPPFSPLPPQTQLYLNVSSLSPLSPPFSPHRNHTKKTNL